MKKKFGIASGCLLLSALAMTSLTAYAETNYHDPMINSKPAAKADFKDLIVKKKNYKDAPVKEEEEKSWIDNLTGSLAFTTDYVFRGVSQSENLPAVQGGLTYTLPFGFYLNLWGSNVKFTGSDATVEFDTVAGIGGDLLEEIKYDINFARYTYPRARDLNYNELNTLFNYKFLQFAFSYSANAYDTHKTGLYYNGGINYDIPSKYALGVENVNILALFGHYSLPRAGGNSYNDYIIALSKAVKKYTFTLQWTDTNGRQKNPPYDSGIVAATIAAEF